MRRPPIIGIIATLVAVLCAALVAVFFVFGRDGASTDATVANAMQECVRGASGTPPQGRLTPPEPPAEAWFPLPKGYHDWKRGTAAYYTDDDDFRFVMFEVAGLGLVTSGEGTVITKAADGTIAVSYSGNGALTEGASYDLWEFLDFKDDPKPKEVAFELRASLKPGGTAGTATATIDGKKYEMDAAPAPKDAEDAACASLQLMVSGDWKTLLKDLPDLDPAEDVDKLAEDIRVAMAESGILKMAILDGELTYEQESDSGYPVAYGRAKLTFEKGKLTTTEGSNIAMVYKGKWQLFTVSGPDEFEDSGTGEAVVVDPVEGGLLSYSTGDGWPGQRLIVQLDPNAPNAGRFAFLDDEDGLFWSKTPGKLSTGTDGMTHLTFDGDGFWIEDGHFPFEEGDVFSPPDGTNEDEVSKPQRFSIDVTFRDAGKTVSGSITNEHGTKRFALGKRVAAPEHVIDLALIALKKGDWQGLDKLLRYQGDIAGLQKHFPKGIDFGTAVLSPERSWASDNLMNRRGYVRTTNGAYTSLQIQAQWDKDDKTWWLFVGSDDFTSLKPTVCVQQELDGSLTAYLGYVNDLGMDVTLEAGALNRLVSSDLPVPTVFELGTHNRVIAVKLATVKSVTWVLNGTIVTADPKRPHPPVAAAGATSFLSKPCP